MGEMTALNIMRQLLKEGSLPDKMTVTWNVNNDEEAARAENRFLQYLDDGWMAFRDEPDGRKQIFQFNPHFKRIILIPPLGGG